MKRKIDHIVYAVLDLERAIDQFEMETGCRPIFGGYHTTQGTKNALVNLGDGCYLEFLAIDKDNKKITVNRWMGIDLVSKPTITRWALKSNDLEKEAKILKVANPNLAKITAGQRTMENGKTLNWKLTMPLPKPKVELIPFLLDWSDSEVHPTDNLVQECELIEMKFITQNPDYLSTFFKKFSFDSKVVKGNAPEIKLLIKSVKGIIEI